MSGNLIVTAALNPPVVYQIRLEGQLGRPWAEWFDGLTIMPADNGDTLLICAVSDQAALYGLLRKVRDLGMPLVSINRVYSVRSEPSDLHQ